MKLYSLSRVEDAETKPAFKDAAFRLADRRARRLGLGADDVRAGWAAIWERQRAAPTYAGTARAAGIA